VVGDSSDADARFPAEYYAAWAEEVADSGEFTYTSADDDFAAWSAFIFPDGSADALLWAHFGGDDDWADIDDNSATYQEDFMEALAATIDFFFTCLDGDDAVDFTVCDGTAEDDDENDALDFFFRWLDFASVACGAVGDDDLCGDRADAPLWPGVYSWDRTDVFSLDDGVWTDATCYDADADDWTELCATDYLSLLAAWFSDLDTDELAAVEISEAGIWALMDEYEIAATYSEDFADLAGLFCGEDDDGEAIGWDACELPFDAFCAADVDTMLEAAADWEDFGRDTLDDMNDFLESFVGDDEETAAGVDFLFAMCDGDRSGDVLDFYDEILAVFALALADDVNFPYTATCTTSLAAGVAGVVDSLTGAAGLPGCALCDDTLEDQIAGFTCASAADVAALAAAASEIIEGEEEEEEECDEDDEDAECEDDEDASQSFALGFSVLAVLASLLN